MTKDRNSNPLSEFYAKRLEEFSEWSKGSSTGHQRIHELRLSIKRLRAVFNLLNIITPERTDSKNYYHLYKHVFKTAGHIREAQVNRKAFEKKRSDKAETKAYLHFLHAHKKKAEKKFKKALHKFDSKKARRSKAHIAAQLSGINRYRIISDCKAFMRTEAGKIGHLLKHSDDDTVLHEIRKRLKAIGAITTLLNDLKPGKQMKQVLKSIKHTEDCIGQWHDRLVLAESLDAFLKTKSRKNFSGICQLTEELHNNHNSQKRIQEKASDTLKVLLAFSH